MYKRQGFTRGGLFIFSGEKSGVCSMFDSGVYSRDFLLSLPGVWRFSLSAIETKSGNQKEAAKKDFVPKGRELETQSVT